MNPKPQKILHRLVWARSFLNICKICAKELHQSLVWGLQMQSYCFGSSIRTLSFRILNRRFGIRCRTRRSGRRGLMYTGGSRTCLYPGGCFCWRFYIVLGLGELCGYKRSIAYLIPTFKIKDINQSLKSYIPVADIKKKRKKNYQNQLLLKKKVCVKVRKIEKTQKMVYIQGRHKVFLKNITTIRTTKIRNDCKKGTRKIEDDLSLRTT